jgi:hypothetical protein
MIFSENRCPLFRIMLRGAEALVDCGGTRKSRSCAELKAQAEAGPLMPMMRRANMGFP